MQRDAEQTLMCSDRSPRGIISEQTTADCHRATGSNYRRLGCALLGAMSEGDSASLMGCNITHHARRCVSFPGSDTAKV